MAPSACPRPAAGPRIRRTSDPLPEAGGRDRRNDVPARRDRGRRPVDQLRRGLSHLARLLPRAELHVFEESAHMIFVEEPEQYLEVLCGFLARSR